VSVVSVDSASEDAWERHLSCGSFGGGLQFYFVLVPPRRETIFHTVNAGVTLKMTPM
jgi:hypothetical protein